MDAVLNLHREPALREKLDYHPVHNNTVPIDNNQGRDGSRGDRRYPSLPRTEQQRCSMKRNPSSTAAPSGVTPSRKADLCFELSPRLTRI